MYNLRFLSLFILLFLLTQYAFADINDPPTTVQNILFIHHSCGSNWMNSGLVDSLEDSNNPATQGMYSFHDAEYGSHLGQGSYSPGGYTDFRDWYYKFLLDYDREGNLVDMLNCDDQNTIYTDTTEVNNIIMVKSCYPNSKVDSDTTFPNDIGLWLDTDYPSGSFDYTNFYNENTGIVDGWSGTGGTMGRLKATFTALLDILRQHPETMFIYVAAPALTYASYSAPYDPETGSPVLALNTHLFNKWLIDEWLDNYEDDWGNQNIFIFDWYHYHTYSDDPTNPNYYIDLGVDSDYLWTLRSDYSNGGDNHPNQTANEVLTDYFIHDFINQAYNTWKGNGLDAPSNLTATADNYNKTITLNWQDNSEGELGFMIDRCEDWGGWDIGYAFVDSNEITFIDTGLTFLPYAYRIAAYNSSDTSAYSNQASAAIEDTGTGIIIENENINLPSEYELFSNYPNPFNPNTNITYNLPIATNIKLVIYNTCGELIRILVAENQIAGTHNILWNGLDMNGKSVPSGIYIYTLEANTFKDSKKMLLIK